MQIAVDISAISLALLRRDSHNMWGEPGPFLGAIFDDCPEEFLGKFWEVMGRSWPNPGGILGCSTILLNPSKNVSTAKAEQILGAFLGDCLGEFWEKS